MSTDKNNDFWVWVEVKTEEMGISFSELERRSGASKGGMVRRKNDQKLPTVEMAEGMCKALKVSWVELWHRAGLVKEYSPAEVVLTGDELTGLDEELYYLLRDRSDDFKAALLKTAKAWVLYEEMNK